MRKILERLEKCLIGGKKYVDGDVRVGAGAQLEFGTCTSNFMKVFNVNYFTLTSQLKMSCRKINIASEKVINYRATSPSNH